MFSKRRLVALSLLLSSCGGGTPSSPSTSARPPASSPAPPFSFVGSTPTVGSTVILVPGSVGGYNGLTWTTRVVRTSGEMRSLGIRSIFYDAQGRECATGGTGTQTLSPSVPAEFTSTLFFLTGNCSLPFTTTRLGVQLRQVTSAPIAGSEFQVGWTFTLGAGAGQPGPAPTPNPGPAPTPTPRPPQPTPNPTPAPASCSNPPARCNIGTQPYGPPTARCKDGTWSCSTGSGTCSSHGGVDCWVR